MKKVSVIVPVYNGQKTIKECILNIQNNNPNIFKEIIIINDNSNDNTKKILKSLKKVKIIKSLVLLVLSKKLLI